MKKIFCLILIFSVFISCEEKLKVPKGSKIVAKYVVFDEATSTRILKDTTKFSELEAEEEIKYNFKLGKFVYVVEYEFIPYKNGRLKKSNIYTYNRAYEKPGIGLKKNIIDYEKVGLDFHVKFTSNGTKVIDKKDTLDIHQIYEKQKLLVTEKQNFAHRKVFYRYK